MNIPFFDLKRQYLQIKADVNAQINETFNNASFILGEKVSQFETEFANYCETKHCITVGSGTDALHIALRAAGVQPGDEVILPTHTFAATALAAWYAGARPVFVDIREDTYCIDPEQIKKAITKKTKAIVPVHMYGQYAGMDEIMEIAAEENLIVIEDAAQSHGAQYKQSRKPRGTMACYSFYPTKNLGAYGDGGAIITDNNEMAEKIRLLRNYGQKVKYEHVIKGFNSRLDEIQAAILLAKIKHLNEWINKRRRIARQYDEMLQGVRLPVEAEYGKHSYYLYVIRSKSRNKLQEHLKSKGITTLIHYPIPVHKQKAFAEYSVQKMPIAEKAAEEILSLPMFPELKAEEINIIARSINEF